LLQQVNRDTLRFAMKANALQDAAGVWHDVAKTPATDPTKGSKAGRQAVIRRAGRLAAVRSTASIPRRIYCGRCGAMASCSRAKLSRNCASGRTYAQNDRSQQR